MKKLAFIGAFFIIFHTGALITHAQKTTAPATTTTKTTATTPATTTISAPAKTTTTTATTKAATPTSLTTANNTTDMTTLDQTADETPSCCTCINPPKVELAQEKLAQNETNNERAVVRPRISSAKMNQR